MSVKFIQLLLTNDLCRDEADGGHCFTQAEEDARGRGGYEVDTRDLASLRVDCPPDLDGECPEDQPDPPEAPEPPEPECGDLEVAEPGAVQRKYFPTLIPVIFTRPCARRRVRLRAELV